MPPLTEEERRAAFETVEYGQIIPELKITSALHWINASSAYARGATGEGETVLVIEDGITPWHHDIGSDRITIATGEYYLSGGLGGADHGNAVVGIISAVRQGRSIYTNNEPGMHGVAFDAHAYIVPSSLLGESTEGSYFQYDLEAHTEQDDLDEAAYWQQALYHAGIAGAGIINFSRGRYGGAISGYDSDLVREKFRHTAEVLAQRGVNDADKKIIVHAAGNQGYDSPVLLKGLGVHFPELRNILVVAIAISTRGDQAGEVAEFSNRCGITKSYCLAAPGDPVYTVANWRYRYFRGTSAAAPMVSGALAVMRQHFRGQLGNTELVERLFATADKTGIYANSDIYGQGLLDLDQATRPLGDASIALGRRVGGEALPLRDSSLKSLGPASGDALARALDGRELAVFDRIGSPFFLDVGSLLGGPEPHTSVFPDWQDRGVDRYRRGFRLADGELEIGLAGRRDGTGTRIGQAVYRRTDAGGHERFLSFRGQPGSLVGHYRHAEDPAREFSRLPFHSAPHLRFLGDGLGLGGSFPLKQGPRLSYGIFRGRAHFAGWDEAEGASNTGALLGLGALGGNISLQAGVLEESAGFAGVSPQGAFGTARGRTFFGGASAGAELDERWHARASAYAGRTRPRLRSRGILREAGPVTTSSFGLSLEGRGIADPQDTLLLSVDQPLRVERGSARVRLPVGRTVDKEVVHETFEIGLEPSARAIGVRVGYSRPLGPATVGLAFGAERHAGHSRANGTDLHGSLSFDLRF